MGFTGFYLVSLAFSEVYFLSSSLLMLFFLVFFQNLSPEHICVPFFSSLFLLSSQFFGCAAFSSFFLLIFLFFKLNIQKIYLKNVCGPRASSAVVAISFIARAQHCHFSFLFFLFALILIFANFLIFLFFSYFFLFLFFHFLIWQQWVRCFSFEIFF